VSLFFRWTCNQPFLFIQYEIRTGYSTVTLVLPDCLLNLSVSKLFQTTAKADVQCSSLHAVSNGDLLYRMVICSDHEMTPEDWLSILHALVVLAVDTNSGRGEIRITHDVNEGLRSQRFSLKKDIGKLQKELKENSKALKEVEAKAKSKAESKDAQNSGGADAKGERVEKKTIYTRSRGENPLDKLARDQAQLALVENQLRDVQVWHASCWLPISARRIIDVPWCLARSV
jgi:hypothetical protein